MKTLVIHLLSIAVILVIAVPTYSQTGSGEKGNAKKKRKLIEVHRATDETAWMDFKRGWYGFAALSPAKVIGIKKIESDGFRFVPAMETPEWLPQGAFNKFYQMSPLVKEIFIPFDEVKSVKLHYGITIRTKDGRKFHFRCKKPKQVAREIKSHLH